jgi:hypothetical protein
MMLLLSAPVSSLSSQTSSDIWFGGQEPSSYAQTSQTADLETNIQSSSLLQSWNKWYNALKSHIISAGLSLYYLQTSLFISVYQTAVGIVSPVEFANKACHFQYKLWENHDLTVQPVIIYIYLCG